MTDALPPEDNSGLSLKWLTHIIYGLFALGVLTAGFLGISTLAAIVLAYVKRSDAAGTIYAVHFDWVIKTFWWGLLWLLISGLLTFVFIGWLVGLAVVIWVVYRLIKGWLALVEGTAPSPEL